MGGRREDTRRVHRVPGVWTVSEARSSVREVRGPRRALLCLIPAALAATADTEARAAPLEPPRVERTHGLATLRSEARLPDFSGRELRARLRRGERTALETPFALTADGRGEVLLRTARLLLPGRYVLEVTAPGTEEPLERVEFALGNPEEARAAAQRMHRWYLVAARRFRDLAAALERRGRWHRAVAERTPARRGEMRERFDERFLPGWEAVLRMARMDLATYQRRLLLPPRPRIAELLLRLVPLLRARAEVWATAFDPNAAAPGPAAEVEAVAEELRSLLPELGSLTDWRAGPLAQPESRPEPGQRFRSLLGVSVLVPAGARLHPTTDPGERLGFATDGLEVRLRAEERPDLEDPDALARAVEVSAWETWQGYKRLSSERTPDRGLRLEFRARVSGRSVQAVQRFLFPPGGRRVISLLVLRAPGSPYGEQAQAIERSLRWERP